MPVKPSPARQLPFRPPRPQRTDAPFNSPMIIDTQKYPKIVGLQTVAVGCQKGRFPAGSFCPPLSRKCGCIGRKKAMLSHISCSFAYCLVEVHADTSNKSCISSLYYSITIFSVLVIGYIPQYDNYSRKNTVHCQHHVIGLFPKEWIGSPNKKWRKK